MGQPLMKGPGPFAKLSRIFRRTFADFRYKFPKKIGRLRLYMNVVLNKSSQELPFRKSFACFRGPIGVAFSKIENSYKDITSLL